MKSIPQNTSWYVEYSPSITKEIFDNFISLLNNNGYVFLIHCGFSLNYNEFLKQRFIRNKHEFGSSRHYHEFCIDNNNQQIATEINIFDYVDLYTINYEIY